jgi:hypothetical protein
MFYLCLFELNLSQITQIAGRVTRNPQSIDESKLSTENRNTEKICFAKTPEKIFRSNNICKRNTKNNCFNIKR